MCHGLGETIRLELNGEQSGIVYDKKLGTHRRVTEADGSYRLLIRPGVRQAFFTPTATANYRLYLDGLKVERSDLAALQTLSFPCVTGKPQT